MSFAENLQYLRKRDDMTQEQLAEKLEVSRQAVSKWESGNSYPEMDNLIQMSELFTCNLEILIRGDATVGDKKDSAGYDRHMNRYGIIIAGAVAFIISAVAVTTLLELLLPEAFANIIMFLMVAVGVSALIIASINHDYFVKCYPEIQDFYEEEEKRSFHRRFAVAIASGVCLIFLGLSIVIGLEYVGNGLWEFLGNGLFLLCVAAGTFIFIYFGIQEDKYNIEKYNNDNCRTKTPKQKLPEKISGCIMLLATAIFLYLGLVHDLFGIAWVVYPIGGLLCGIAYVIWGEVKI